MATAKASIDMYLIEASKKTFDPDALDTGEVEPKVSVAEAIRIVQLHGSSAQREDLNDPYADRAACTDEEAAEIREELVRKLRRLRDRDMPVMIAQGWQFDEEFERMIPPGWIRDPDHVPSPPDDDRQVDAPDQ
ncbi:MAG: hypothetical protein ABIS38_04050 [Sphingomicrobium sp.]